MQGKEFDGTYNEPEPLDFEKLKRNLFDEKLESMLVFRGLDRNRHPTKELRRAWRRAEKTQKGCKNV